MYLVILRSRLELTYHSPTEINKTHDSFCRTAIGIRLGIAPGAHNCSQKAPISTGMRWIEGRCFLTRENNTTRQEPQLP